MRLVTLVVSALLAGIFDDPSNPPFSIDRIRDSLAQTPPEPALLPAAQPQFRVNIVERQRFGDRVPPDFRGGPVPPGGLYAYEQRQRIGPPMAQPLVVIDITPIASAIVAAIRDARRSGETAAAREDVRRAIGQYCAAQPDRGAGIQICAMSPAIR